MPETKPRPRGEGHIGSDEAGKGDYFGDLAVAAVFLEEELAPQLRALGVRDCKGMADSTLFRLEKEIRELCPHEVIRIHPPRYNELYLKLKNLNRLLAWAHARAVENLLGKGVRTGLVITDKFADERVLEAAVMEAGRQVEVRQVVRAEEDPAVAAASILARAAFLRSLRRLAEEISLSTFTGLRELPRGSTQVKGVARLLLKQGGRDLLARVAKLHFKITKELVGES